MEEVVISVCRKGTFESAKLAIDQDHNEKREQAINKIGATSTNALHVAVWRDHLPLVELLLSNGADPNIQDTESGWTPLHRAFYFGQLRIAAALLAANANLTIPDWKGRTPVDLLSQELALLLEETGPGEVYSWGNGTTFSLGTGSTEVELAPSRIETLHNTRIAALSAGKFHSVAVSADGQLYSWGWGHGGRLGHPEAHIHSGQSAVIAPRLVVGLGRKRVAAVAAAKHHTLLCTTAGEVYTMGSNRYGQLGYPAIDTQPTPRRVASIKCRITTVAAANKHSIAVSSVGEVYTWGSNALGQLGYGASDSTSSANPRVVEAIKGKEVISAAAAKRHTVVLTSSGEVFTWGHRGVSPRKVQFFGVRDHLTASGKPLKFHRGHNEVVKPTIRAICAGAAHSSALTTTGVVLTWRSADPGLLIQEIGGGLAGKNVTHIAAGKYRTAAVTAEGDVYMWEGRSDFFPAENRASGSGSKKAATGVTTTTTTTIASAAMSGSIPAPVTPQLTTGIAIGSHDAGVQGASYGSSGHRRGSGASYFDRIERLRCTDGDRSPSQFISGASPDNTFSSSLKAGLRPSNLTSYSIDAATAAFSKIVPERVHGLKRAGYVAVGEKHSLAIQRWSAVQLPGLPRVHWLKAHPSNTTATTTTILDNYSREGTDADDDDNDEGLDIYRGEDSEGNCEPSPLSSPSKPHQSKGALSTIHGVPSLQQLCEEAVAMQLVLPRSALQVMEYADAAGAHLLKAYCACVALCNLDAVLLEAGGAFEFLESHLLEELERVWKLMLSGQTTVTTPATGEESGNEWVKAHDQRASRAAFGKSLLQPGERPTCAPSYLGDTQETSYMENTSTGNNNNNNSGGGFTSVVSPSRSASSSGGLPLQSQSSFKDLPALEEEQAFHRIRRTLLKKVQQIERLEELATSGAPLDEQQRAKIHQRAIYTAALTALEGGMPTDEVQAMLKAAAAQLTSSSFTYASPNMGTSKSLKDASSSKRTSSAKKNKIKEEKQSSVGGLIRKDDAVVDVGVGGDTNKQQPYIAPHLRESGGLTGKPSQPTASVSSTAARVSFASGAMDGAPCFQCEPSRHVVGFTEASFGQGIDTIPAGSDASSSGKQARRTPIRKGGLSMFLRGDLDNGSSTTTPSKKGALLPNAAVGVTSPWGSNPVPAKPKSALKDIFQQQSSSGTTSTTPSKLPPTPTSATASGGGGGVSRLVPLTPQTLASMSERATASASGDTTSAPRSSGIRIPLADFLLQDKDKEGVSTKQIPPPLAWGGAAAAASGSSPKPSNLPSLKAIQQQQQELQRNSITGNAYSSSPPPSGLVGWRAGGAAAAGLLGTSPSNGAGTMLLYGSSPLGRVFQPSSGPPQSKWYVPEESQARAKSITAIQSEETEAKEIEEAIKLVYGEQGSAAHDTRGVSGQQHKQQQQQNTKSKVHSGKTGGDGKNKDKKVGKNHNGNKKSSNTKSETLQDGAAAGTPATASKVKPRSRGKDRDKIGKVSAPGTGDSSSSSSKADKNSIGYPSEGGKDEKATAKPVKQSRGPRGPRKKPENGAEAQTNAAVNNASTESGGVDNAPRRARKRRPASASAAALAAVAAGVLEGNV